MRMAIMIKQLHRVDIHMHIYTHAYIVRPPPPGPQIQIPPIASLTPPPTHIVSS